MFWRVSYVKAFEEWRTLHRPSGAQEALVLLWVASLESYGPLDDSVPVVGDLYVYTIRPAQVRAEFLAIFQDQNLIVRRFIPIDDALF